MDDFRFEELRVQIYPQSGADSIPIVVDTATDTAPDDAAAKGDTGGTPLTAAGRPQPPPAVAVGAIDIRSTSNRILGRFTLSCAIGAEVLASASLKVMLVIPPRPITVDMADGIYDGYMLSRSTDTIFVTAD